MTEKVRVDNDYCHKCGCPLDICCGQGKISIENLFQILDEVDCKPNVFPNKYDVESYLAGWQTCSSKFADEFLKAKKEVEKNE